MGKQAMGCIGLNQMWRTDSVLLVGLYPQRPMCRTKAMELFDYERLGAGINAMVAVMSYSGYDIEDAQVYNRDAFDRGYGRAVVLRRHDAVLSCQDPKHRDRLLPPPTGTGKMVQRYRALDQDGIAAKGAFVCPGDILVNKVTPNPNGTIVIGTDKYAPEPVVFKGRDNAVVDHVFISDKGGEQGMVSIKVVTREIRIPEPGDKFSSRHGQKGVVGLITPGVNMPFTEQGIVPDMIMNPHGFPSRMTVGKLMELVAGKAGLVQGRFGDGTAFGGDDAKQMGGALLDKGFQYFGKEALYSGITGDLMPAYVFFGPIYYQRLKHMVADKMHARSTGPRSLLTRQPTEGRARDGGLRVGEMERDCMVGYGAAMLLNERLLKSSDEFCVDVCAECGSLGFHGFCPYCKRKGTVSSVNLPYAFKLLLQEMLGMGITTRLALNKPNA
jgi:DNA-directed RNA polymerase III subunit RPC2